MVGIYKITNPKGKVYIGKSIDIEKRHNIYKNYNCKQQPMIYNSLKKYGWESHKVDILEECTEDILNEREEYWITRYNSVDNGMNLTFGGDGGRRSKITRKKMSKAHQGMKKPWAGLNKLSSEHIEKLRNGRINTMNPIYQYDLEGNFIKEWQNAKQASTHLKINNGYLSTILDSNKTLGGFRFTKTKHEKLSPTTKWDKHKKPIIQYDLEGNLIREWSSAKEAAETLGIRIQNITACCRGESKTAYKSIWKNATC
jgi:group I intron endonuclease